MAGLGVVIRPFPTGSAGKVLLRLKIKSAPAGAGEIQFNCIIHGAPMSGKVRTSGIAGQRALMNELDDKKLERVSRGSSAKLGGLVE